MFPYRLMSALLVVAMLGYVGASFALFELPASAADAENCGFLPDEFNASSGLTYERTQAWGISFLRKQEYWTTISVGLSVAFIGFALATARRNRSAAAGAAMGGGVLAVSALCVSCLAPVLSAVGIGIAGTLLAGVPKWLIALNTLLLTGWGTLYLGRRSASCEMPPAGHQMPASKLT